MTLTELIEALEGATGASRELDGDIALCLGMVPADAMRMSALCPAMFATGPHTSWSARHYTDSIDAALTLVPDGHTAMIYTTGTARVWPVEGRRIDDMAYGATPAIALCIAALRARL